jgi:hypothetical protein
LGEVEDLETEALDGCEALATPAVLAATQFFQSLKCLVSLRHSSIQAIARRLVAGLIRVYTRKHGGGSESGKQAERSVALRVHACALLTLADSLPPPAQTSAPIRRSGQSVAREKGGTGFSRKSARNQENESFGDSTESPKLVLA